MTRVHITPPIRTPPSSRSRVEVGRLNEEEDFERLVDGLELEEGPVKFELDGFVPEPSG